MSNTRQIQSISLWTPNGVKNATILSLADFYDYHFDEGTGKVNYKLIGMESPGTTTDENGNTINLPNSAVEYISESIEIPAIIIQQWGSSDDIIWNYIATTLGIIFSQTNKI